MNNNVSLRNKNASWEDIEGLMHNNISSNNADIQPKPSIIRTDQSIEDMMANTNTVLRNNKKRVKFAASDFLPTDLSPMHWMFNLSNFLRRTKQYADEHNLEYFSTPVLLNQHGRVDVNVTLTPR